jgi:L-alanine-DL-glutamate epimerase-like enolase superfamily enzyme
MPSPTLIRRLDLQDLDLALREPFGISGGAQVRAANLLVTVELADGSIGLGEAAPFPAFNGETREATRTAVQSVREVVVGSDARHWRRVARDLQKSLPGAGAARCAIETAILDAFTRNQKVSLWRYWGSAKRVLRTDFTITTGSPEAAWKAARDVTPRGFKTLKIKVGAGDPLQDVARVLAVRDAAPAVSLILDANAAFTAEEALMLLAALREKGVRPTLFEQPVAREDLAGLARVHREGRVNVAADESACSSADVRRLVDARAAQVINIKLMKCGISEAMDMAWIAREAGLKLMIGGLVESTLAMTVSACFAAGNGGFSHVDLDTPLFLAASPFEGGITYEGDALKFTHIKAGHGVGLVTGDKLQVSS